MTQSPRQGQAPQPFETTADEVVVKAATAWVHQFARTIKTCRLYETGDAGAPSSNSTVVRFRQQLGQALAEFVGAHGQLEIRFTSDDVVFDGQSLYQARSREDNLALPFYRDGIRGITFTAGTTAREVDALVDAFIQVSGRGEGEDDLVTRLWEAQLDHLEVDVVPAEGDVGAGQPEHEVVPWPTGAAEELETAATEPASGESDGSRSDDWAIGELTDEIEAEFEELETLASMELQRFRDEYEAEHRNPTANSALALIQAYIAAGAGPEEEADLARFLPRVLRLSFGLGSWTEARGALAMVRAHPASDWSLDTFVQELLQPISIASIRGCLEDQDAQGLAEFVAFARDIGEPAIDVLNLVLAEVQNPRHHRPLADAIIEDVRANPERLGPWLSDPRPNVVRGVLQMLGTIGGAPIVGMLQSVARHPDPRVRHEVVAALKDVEPRAARPLLLRMLDGADARLFGAVLQQLSQARDPETARILLAMLLDADFDRRPDPEKRAIYFAVSGVGGDEIIPELEAELTKGGLFARAEDPHRQAIAHCIARIGTPLARQVLERGAQSRKGAVRKACEAVLGRFDHRG